MDPDSYNGRNLITIPGFSNTHRDGHPHPVQRASDKHPGISALLTVLLCTPILFACQGTPVPDGTDRLVAPTVPGYAFDKPDATFRLPDALHEISGLTVAGDTAIIAVQDEIGVLYGLSPDDGSIRWTTDFADAGDFEGLELVGDTVWVVRSDGRLFVIRPGSDHKTEVMDSGVDDDLNIEGLGWDTKSQRLLLAAKDYLRKSDNSRVVFSVRPSGRSPPALSLEPAYAIPLDELASRFGVSANKARDFRPSGVAVHPTTGEVFVLSAGLRSIVVLAPQASGAQKLLHVALLDVDLLPQPEGLAFLGNGDLFVSSEDNNRGMLVRYNYRPTR